MQAIPGLIGGPTVAARLQPKQATRAYVQYEKPPLSFDGEAVGVSDVEGFRPRFCLYDYGIISVALTQRSADPGPNSSRSARRSSRATSSNGRPNGCAGR